jgi:hypothetical protein
MPLVPLAIPPGVYRNGTDYQSSGRWRDASLIRWTEGTMQPIGGWVTRATVQTNKKVRGSIAWSDNSADRWMAAGTYEKLFVISASNTVTDITPTGFTPGDESAALNLGYGGGFYGDYTYGTPRQDVVNYTEATTWSLDTWGEYLVACSNADGKIYEWQLDVAADALAVTNAPTGNLGIVVTEERFLFALGAGGNVRKVQWSDREDNTTWTPAATNEAGDLELQTSGQIMLGIKARGQTLILTDLDAHAATYQGPPFVYGFERIGSACGAISRKCAASVDRGVFWMGSRGFFAFAGGQVQDVPCEVSDYVFNNISASQRSKIHAVTNAKFNEIWWFYPSAASNECDSYVVFNYEENHWAIGTLARTSGIDAGVFTTPIWFGTNGIAYNHETGYNLNAETVFAESGPFEIGAGDTTMMASMLIPDEKTRGQVTVTFKTRFYPNDTERSYGPYSMAAPTDVRFTGRQVAMRVTGAANDSWRWGVPRIEAIPGGRR